METDDGSEFADTSDDDDDEDLVPEEVKAAGFESRQSQSHLFAAMRAAWVGSDKKKKWAKRYLSALQGKRHLVSSKEYLTIFADLAEMGEEECVPWLAEGSSVWPVCGDLRLRLVAAQYARGDEKGARRSIEQCLSTAGMVVSTGLRVWTAARAFAADVGDSDLERDLEKRQAGTPLFGGGGALSDERREFETRVASAAASGDDEEAVEAWIEYAEYEARRDEQRAVVVYERAVAALEDREAENVANASLRSRIWEHYALFQPEVASRPLLLASSAATPLLQVLAIYAAERDPSSTSIPLPQIKTLETLLARFDAYRRRGWKCCYTETLDDAVSAKIPTLEIRRSYALIGATREIRKERWKQVLLEEKDEAALFMAARSAESDGDLAEARRLYRTAATRHGESGRRAYRTFERDHGTLQDVLDAERRLYRMRPPSSNKDDTSAEKRRRREDEEGVKKNPKAERIFRTIYLSELSKEATESDLSTFFSTKCGKVALTRVLLDKKTRAPRGAGFVEFVEKESVDAALQLSPSSDLANVLGTNCTIKRSSFLAPDPPPPPPSPPPKKKQKKQSAPLLPRVFAAASKKKKMKIDDASPKQTSPSSSSSTGGGLTNDAFRAAFLG